MEEIVQTTPICSKPSSSSSIERKTRPQKDQALNCPRCNSTNTKFCYYNNYSLSQPRYFCKTCRRYWTAGGSLRNIPVGGGSRKNKRSSSSSNTSSCSSISSATSSKKNVSDLVGPSSLPLHHQNPNKIIHEAQDLNLGFPTSHHDFKTITELIQVPNYETTNKENMATSSSSALELLTGMTSSRGLNSFMPMPPSMADPTTVYSSSSSGFSLPELKPSLNFSLDGLGNNGFGSLQSVQETSGRQLLFPFEDLNSQVSNTTTVTDAHHQNNIDQNADSNGYWNGVLGGGAW